MKTIHLTDLGHDVKTIARDYPASLPDKNVWSLTAQQKRILFTNDRDFGELVFRYGVSHCGILLFRLKNSKDISGKLQWLQTILQSHKDHLHEYLVVTQNGIRIRKKELSPLEKYKEDVPWIIARYRNESNSYRRIANRLQITIIVGSVLVTSATSAAGFEFGGIFKWVAPIISIVVAASAGLTGYFKFRERSFNLQQTADSIEQEYNAVKLGIRYYKGKQPNEALEYFVERVEFLIEEQKKRQQQLEQPSDVKHIQSHL